MPIVKAVKPIIPAPVPTLKIAKDDYKSIQVDSRTHPKDAIVAQMEGAPWPIERYYSQVLARDSGTQGQSLGTAAVLQQFVVIYDMELRVTETLKDTQDPKTKEMTQTGGSNVYPFIIPNTGDMIVAELLDGRKGLFEVTSSERPTTEMDAAYGITYKLVGIDDPIREADLRKKTVKELYFEKDFIRFGQNPLLVSSEYEDYTFVRRQYYSLIRRFFDRHTSKEHATCLMPGQSTATYDHFIVLLMYRMIDSTEDYRIRDLRRMNMDDDQLMGSRSVWDMLIERDRTLSLDIFTKAGLVDTRLFTRFPRADGIRYSGIKQVVYPTDGPLRVDNTLTEPPKAAAPFDPYAGATTNRTAVDYLDRAKQTLPKVPGRTMAHPVMQDGYYVFSKAFYENDRTPNAQSELELCLQDLIDNRKIDFSRVKELIEHLSVSKEVELYYYIPALLVLIKGVIRAL